MTGMRPPVVEVDEPTAERGGRSLDMAIGISRLRRVYDLRHTFATFALRAGISTFDLSRYKGASLTMIDRHSGHLARDGREHAIRLLDTLNAPEFQPWTLVDGAWTSQRQNGVSADNKKVELPA